mmetsp:Transcript_753/g.1207  ORF Transcript_753/g.1207 Transcript_753/m.1207 type:complete len:243 (+) Transcript_753:241-969(+)
MRSSINITNDRDAGLLNLNSIKDLLQSRNGGSHEISVESSSNCQLNSHTSLKFRLSDLTDYITRLRRSTNSIISRAKEICNLDLFSRFLASCCTDLSNLLFIKPNDRNHSRVNSIGCSLHSLTTSLGDLYSIFERNSACEAKSRILPKTKSHSASSSIDSLLSLLLSELFYSSHTSNENSRLGNLGGVEKLLGSLDASFQKIISKNFTGLVEESLCSRNIFAEISAHTYELCSLSREHESYL